ncbi:sigma 54-interacting transcriptional regulator [Bacteroides sp. OttesenSCG-928-J23]|nr:sigma 54-interacting transcriptional regulator [Bacteroides sp. OttesenSCG-928-J23]
MLRKEKILQALWERGQGLPTTGDTHTGFDATDLAQQLGMRRNTVSHELNELAREGKVIRFPGKPVRFLDADTCARLGLGSPEAVPEIIDPFEEQLYGISSIIGQVEQAKAAILYPPAGLHTLIVGKTGTGKSHFAHIMYRYALACGAIGVEAPFISFNCADYAETPQLLTSQLFGHVKGSFTGADSSKAGLVAQAEGGFLFLDEIHSLPPEGQEMLFTLIDKGIYRRLGETTAEHRANVRIVCATTNLQQGQLLSTFLRRIPVIIELPPLERRAVSDRYQLIRHFFEEEAARVGRRLTVDKDIVNQLLFTEFEGNIGELHNTIQLLCSRAFVNALEDGGGLTIDRHTGDFLEAGRFSREILQIYIGLGADGVNRTLVADPAKNGTAPAGDRDFYDKLEAHYQQQLQAGADPAEAGRSVEQEAGRHFQLLRDQSKRGIALRLEMSKIVPQAILDLAGRLMEQAAEALGRTFRDDVLLGLSLHTKSFINRSMHKKRVRHPNADQLAARHPAEFALAEDYVWDVSRTFLIPYSRDEAAFVAMFLLSATDSPAPQRDFAAVMLCHGEGVATALARAVNALLGEPAVLALDMPLESSPDQSYDRLRDLLAAHPPRRGVLLLTDMGSLNRLGERLWQDNSRRLEVGTLSGFNTLTALDAVRRLGREGARLADVMQADYRETVQMNLHIARPREERLVWTCCNTGVGTAERVKHLLQHTLRDICQCTIVAMDQTSLSERMAGECVLPAVLVGGPGLEDMRGVEVISLAHLLQEDGVARLLRLLGTPEERLPQAREQLSAAITLESLTGTMEAIDPVKAVDLTRLMAQSLAEKTGTAFDQARLVRLLVHTSFMVERLVLHRDALDYPGAENYRLEHPALFSAIDSSLEVLEEYFGIAVPLGERAFIADILRQ